MYMQGGPVDFRKPDIVCSCQLVFVYWVGRLDIVVLIYLQTGSPNIFVGALPQSLLLFRLFLWACSTAKLAYLKLNLLRKRTKMKTIMLCASKIMSLSGVLNSYIGMGKSMSVMVIVQSVSVSQLPSCRTDAKILNMRRL